MDLIDNSFKDLFLVPLAQTGFEPLTTDKITLPRLPRWHGEAEDGDGGGDEGRGHQVELELSGQVEGDQAEEDDQRNTDDDVLLKKQRFNVFNISFDEIMLFNDGLLPIATASRLRGHGFSYSLHQ